MRGCNDLASARLVVYAKIFEASTGGFEEFACRMRMQKRVVQKSQNWLSAFFTCLSSLLPVVCFLRNRSVFIMIARDSLSFGFSCFALL